MEVAKLCGFDLFEILCRVYDTLSLEKSGYANGERPLIGLLLALGLIGRW